MTMTQSAREFFDACETGKGWDVCKTWCHEDATFSCQAGALADIKDLSAYTEWTKWLLGPIPDGHYDLKAFATDEANATVAAVAVFKGTNTGDGGPAPTGKSVASDYVYAMKFDGGKIRHMTKIWNDGHALVQLGWA